MATRFYLTGQSSGIPSYSIRGTWNDTGSYLTRWLSTDKVANDNINTHARSETDSSNTYKVLLYRGVTGPLSAQTISGNVSSAVGCKETEAAADFCWHVHCYVTQGDTDAVRGTLVTDNSDTTANEWATTAQGKSISTGPLGLGSVACSSGDRIVFELGYIARNSSTSSYQGNIYYGTSYNYLTASDLTVSGDALTLAGWVEFDSNLTFNDINIRNTQQVAEVLGVTDANDNAARLTQEVAEVLGNTPVANIEVRSSQQFAEVFAITDPPNVTSQVTQLSVRYMVPVNSKVIRKKYLPIMGAGR